MQFHMSITLTYFMNCGVIFMVLQKLNGLATGTQMHVEVPELSIGSNVSKYVRASCIDVLCFHLKS